MNADHLGSAQVTQDVLLMCGEHDSFQPPSLTRAQAKALTAARSVTVRMFTKSEHADQHCQIGNIGLACRVLTTWLHAPPARNRLAPTDRRVITFVEDICSRIPTALATPSSVHSSSETAHARR